MNPNSDTPRCDAVTNIGSIELTKVNADFARQLEIESDQWRACAEQLAASLQDLLNHGVAFPNPNTGEPEPHQANPGAAEEALALFSELSKGTK